MGHTKIALCAILKNEIDNLDQFLKSFEGCVDAAYLTDTGSTDGTLEKLLKYAEASPFGFPIHVSHFQWIDDFGAARNFNFSNVPAEFEYIIWSDLDDVMGNPEEFKKFRDSAMPTADLWFATYHYASDPTGKPVVSFMRERVVKNIPELRWKYFVHEAIVPPKDFPVKAQFIGTWSIVHKRTDADALKDRSRNINLFKERMHTLDARMSYYYGKELFDSRNFKEAAPALIKACAMSDLDQHDRILGLQFAAYALLENGDTVKCIEICMEGIKLFPHRAEYHCLIGDAIAKEGRQGDALPFYGAAMNCVNLTPQGGVAPIFSNAECYGWYPRIKAAHILYGLTRFEDALKLAEECLHKYAHKECEEFIKELHRAMGATKPDDSPREIVPDIVFACPPVGPYEWDGDIYRAKGVGGSETACVEMAENMARELPGKQVVVFNNRHDVKVINRVIYRPAKMAHEYFAKYQPEVCINWRHSARLTKAPTYLWSHDVVVPGAESLNFDKYVVLSPWQAGYVSAMQKIPDDKIMLSRNGVVLDRFKNQDHKHSKTVFVWPSSPDRGLLRAVKVLDRVRQITNMPIELRVYYGFENMVKGGMFKEIEKIKTECGRPWVKWVGNLPQKELIKSYEEAGFWLYPTDFTETFCITALETLFSGVFPIVRNYAGVGDTLKPFSLKGQAMLIDADCNTSEEIELWAENVVTCINKFDLLPKATASEEYGWNAVAKEWIEEMGLKP